MATIYVDSNAGTPPHDGADWAGAYLTLADCETAEAPYAVDQEIWLASDHAETTASGLVFAFANGTDAQPIRLLSVNSGTDEFASGAHITATGSASDIVISTGASVWFGVKFTAPDNFLAGTVSTSHKFFSCITDIGDVPFGGIAGFIILECHDCTLESADAIVASIVVDNQGIYLFRNCTITMGSANSGEPVVDFSSGDSNITIVFEDCDFSGCTADMHLVTFDAAAVMNQVTFRRCKLPSSYQITTTIPRGNTIRVESCSGGTDTVPFLGITNWTDEFGVTQATTTQKRTGGASDGDQTFSWEMNPNVNVSFYSPLESPPITYWATPGAQTVTIHIANDVDLDTDECWMVVEHPDVATPANPDHIVLSNTKPNPLVTGNAIARDAGSTWDGAGTGTDGSTGQQKLVSSSFNPTEAGPVIIRVYLAKDDTMYVDPQPVIA